MDPRSIPAIHLPFPKPNLSPFILNIFYVVLSLLSIPKYVLYFVFLNARTTLNMESLNKLSNKPITKLLATATVHA